MGLINWNIKVFFIKIESNMYICDNKIYSFMIVELLETKKIVSNFDNTILESPYKVEYISAKSNIPLPTLYRKIRENKFTIDEILLILEIIQPEQYQFEMLSQNIKIAEEQFRNGEFIEEENFVFDVDTIIANRK